MSRPGWGYHYTPCNPGGGSLVRGGLAVAAVAAGGVWVLDTAGVWLAVAAGVCVVLAWPFARVVRWSRRLSVVTVPAAVIGRRPGEVVPARPARPAITTGQRALPAPAAQLPGVTVTLTARDYVREPQ